MTDMYLQLDYRGYKHLERQLLNWAELETTHVSMDQRYYHKALRLEIGDLTLEIQGPAVREAITEETVARLSEEAERGYEPSQLKPLKTEEEFRKMYGPCTCNKIDPPCTSCNNIILYKVGHNIAVSFAKEAEALTEETKDPCETPHAPHLCACIGTCENCR